MAESSPEQDKSLDASPFKLQKAREKGSIARGLDLSFFGALLALAGFVTIAGYTLVARLAEAMRRALTGGIAAAGDPRAAAAFAGDSYRATLQPLLLFGATIVLIILLLEILQLRGFLFTTQPLKPDFSRLNPAKGLKRIFSMRMLKEALKSILKITVYTGAAVLLVRAAIAHPGRALADAAGLAGTMRSAGMRLLWIFVALAFFFAALDQILARREFAKQMRMSKREMTREAKEREGEPRIKRKRKQLHAEFVKNAGGLGKLGGSDLLVVNPDHYAVALAYDRKRSAAPTVTAKGRNLHALLLKARARQLGVPVFENPPLARALHADCAVGSEIAEAHYHAVADLYFKLAGRAAAPGGDEE